MENKVLRRIKKHKSIRSKVLGTSQRPRLVVFRSNRHTYAHLVDDLEGKTISGSSDLSLKDKLKMTKSERAYEIGKSIAQIAKKKGIKRAVFDRSGYLYHGRIKRLAEGAREGGLEF